MIRLGSLAGYPFEGPRLLAGWTPPASAAVYAILYKPEPDAKPDRYAVIYVGHSEDLSAERFPFQHPRAHCWVRRAGSKWKVYICTYEVPGGGPGHREQITRELAAIYQPRCNTERYDQSWKDEWIGEYSSAPNTGPLARRGPGTPVPPRPPGAGPQDTRPQIAGLQDAGLQDAGLQDAGLQRAGTNDVGTQDAGPQDTESQDT
jgi:hypothetical protein